MEELGFKWWRCCEFLSNLEERFSCAGYGDIDVTQLYESCGLDRFLSSDYAVWFIDGISFVIFVGSSILLFRVGFFSLDNSSITVSIPIGKSSVRLCSLGRNWFWSLNLRINCMSIPLFWIDASLFLAIHWFGICCTDSLRYFKEWRTPVGYNYY